MKVLVTGATGFIGRKLVAALVEAGHDATAFVRPTSNRSGLPEGIQFCEGDMLDEASLKKAVEGHDVVVHLAAYFDFYPSDVDLLYRVNIEGPTNLMRACVGTSVSRFIYCSTTEVIGPVRFPPGNEDTELRPQFDYAKSKVEAECAIRDISEETGLDYIILRPTGIMGEGDLYIMYEVAHELYHGKVFALPRDLSAQFMFAHIDDVVSGFVAALTPMTAINSTIILSPDDAISWEEFVEVVTSRLGVKPPRLRVPKLVAKFGMAILSPFKNRKKTTFFWHMKSVDILHQERVYSNEKAKRLLGWAPRVAMPEGFQRAIDWYFEHGYLKKE
ncbi:MAG: NAD-dependent epimerase/dehydratase family protein [Candidatus Thorarchaeota archaeon]|jgi:nucleoside-diphosphate-sugar epimerase